MFYVYRQNNRYKENERGCVFKHKKKTFKKNANLVMCKYADDKTDICS